MEKSRQLILSLVEAGRRIESDFSLKKLSRLLGRNDAYLHQYVQRGTPKILPEQLRHQLAALLGTNEQLLHEDGWQGESNIPASLSPIQAIPFLDGAKQPAYSAQYFGTADLLEQVPQSQISQLRMAVLLDESMAPEMPKGTMVMINMADTALDQAGDQTRDRAGLFLFRDETGRNKTGRNKHSYILRRITLLAASGDGPRAQQVRMSANNPEVAGIRTAISYIHPLGRMIWFARSLT